MNRGELINIWPRKFGYLRKQINSVFDIWNTRYFYLDGTNLLYFIDENDDKPREIIDLRGCLIDGVWFYESIWTFTIRSLSDENLFYYLGAFSESDAEDWIKNLKSSIVLKEFELITNQLLDPNEESELADFHSELITEHDRNNPISDNFVYFNNLALTKPSNEEYAIPHKTKNKTEAAELAYEEFKQILRDKNMEWEFLKQDTCMKIHISSCPNQQNRRAYKASFVVEGDLPSFSRIFENHLNSDLWNVNLKDSCLIKRIDEHTEVYKETYQLCKKDKTHILTDKFIKYSWMEAEKLYMIKCSLDKSMKYDLKRDRRSPDTIDLNIIMEGIRIESYELTGNAKCLFTCVIVVPESDITKHPIIENYLCQYLINHTMIKWEYHEILEKIWERSVSWVSPQTPEPKPIQLAINSTLGTSPRINSNREQSQTYPHQNLKHESASGSNRKENENAEITLEKRQSEELPSVKRFKEITGMKNLDSHFEVDSPAPLDRRSALNENQIKVYVEFKRKYPEADDNMLVRFLIARDFNLINAEEALIKYKDWYKESNVEKMSYKDFENFDEKFWRLVSVPGRDNEGRPICIIRCCRYLPKEILPRNVDQYVWIMDTENVTHRNVAIDSLRWQIEVTASCFPERMKAVYILYSNWMIKGVWNTVKFFVPERSRYKFKFIGGAKKEIYQSLVEMMSENFIPEKYGGKLKMLDPYDYYYYTEGNFMSLEEIWLNGVVYYKDYLSKSPAKWVLAFCQFDELSLKIFSTDKNTPFVYDLRGIKKEKATFLEGDLSILRFNAGTRRSFELASYNEMLIDSWSKTLEKINDYFIRAGPKFDRGSSNYGVMKESTIEDKFVKDYWDNERIGTNKNLEDTKKKITSLAEARNLSWSQEYRDRSSAMYKSQKIGGKLYLKFESTTDMTSLSEEVPKDEMIVVESERVLTRLEASREIRELILRAKVFRSYQKIKDRFLE